MTRENLCNLLFFVAFQGGGKAEEKKCRLLLLLPSATHEAAWAAAEVPVACLPELPCKGLLLDPRTAAC